MCWAAALKPDEAAHVSEMVRRIAAILLMGRFLPRRQLRRHQSCRDGVATCLNSSSMNFIHRNRAWSATRRRGPSAIMQRIAILEGEAHGPRGSTRSSSQMGQPAGAVRGRAFARLWSQSRRDAHKAPRPSRGSARGANHAWPPLNAKLYRQLFPQMTFWLPEEEGAQLRFEFEADGPYSMRRHRATPPSTSTSTPTPGGPTCRQACGATRSAATR